MTLTTTMIIILIALTTTTIIIMCILHPTQQHCSASCTPQVDSIPCQNMSLLHAPNLLVWRYLTLTYRPDDGYYGYDTVRLLVTDEGGLGGVVATVTFGVMEQPCENGGACVGEELCVVIVSV